jgi:hypothetical protein
MAASLPLPPTGRDFLIYHRITVDAASTRAVANETGISQTRVRQIVKKVMHWLAQTLPPGSDLDEAAIIRLSQHIAADRLERFYVEANRLWQQTTQIKFAGLCLRVIAAQAKVPALPGALEAHAMDAIIGPLPDDNLLSREQTSSRSAEAGTQPSAPNFPGPGLVPANGIPNERPPRRDCSPVPSAKPPATQPSPEVPAPTSAPAEPCDNMPPAIRAARQAFLAPAHPLSDSDNTSPVTELKITPQQLGFSTKKHLSRRDRRRLRRKELAKQVRSP